MSDENRQEGVIVKRTPTQTNWSFNPNMWQFAEIYSRSDAVGDCFRGKPDNVYIVLQHASILGVPPLEAVQGMYVVKGKVSAYGDFLLALCMRHASFEDIIEEFVGEVNTDSFAAKCTVCRKGRSPTVRTYSIQDAKDASLWNRNAVWKSYWKRMLQMRARGIALRDSFPDALHGMSVIEEYVGVEGYEVKLVDYPVKQIANNAIDSLSEADMASLINEVKSLLERIPADKKEKLTQMLSIKGLTIETAGTDYLLKIKRRCEELLVAEPTPTPVTET